MLKKFLFVLTIFASISFFWPTLHYQYILSQEDHGRDLYTFAQIAQGKHLYKDMWWEYGPLMPYYYALFNIVFGLKISSVLLGRFVLNIIASLFFYLAACEVMNVSCAFLAACFFMLEQQDFFYTYNHIGGIVFLLALLWLILKYLRYGDIKYKFWALYACLMIGFVKINFGVSALAATLVSIIVIESLVLFKNQGLIKSTRSAFYINGLIIIPLLWVLVYFFLLNGLTVTEINQCLPYFGNNKPILATPLESLKGYWTQHYFNYLTDWFSFLEASILFVQAPIQLLNPLILLDSIISLLKVLVYPVILGGISFTLLVSLTKRFKPQSKSFWLIQLILWLFIIFNFHEFIVSNTWYRSFWSLPFIIFFCFYMVSILMSFVSIRFQYLIAGFFISLFILVSARQFISLKDLCKADKFLTAKTGQIYVGNDPEWVNTINTVDEYLNNNLKKDELFFVMPCDSLFYYLANKEAPSRQTIFFNSFHITLPQEISVINELKKNKVNYVLMSNRIKSASPELGEFGKTYCPLLYRYIRENFTPVFTYGGNLNIPAGWANNHSVMILKRIKPLR